jgi:hypothetical protein
VLLKGSFTNCGWIIVCTVHGWKLQDSLCYRNSYTKCNIVINWISFCFSLVIVAGPIVSMSKQIAVMHIVVRYWTLFCMDRIRSYQMLIRNPHACCHQVNHSPSFPRQKNGKALRRIRNGSSGTLICEGVMKEKTYGSGRGVITWKNGSLVTCHI